MYYPSVPCYILRYMAHKKKKKTHFGSVDVLTTLGA